MASKSVFDINNAVEDYLKLHSAEAEACEAYITGEVLDVNAPGGRSELRALVSGLKKIATGIEADSGIRKRG